LQQWVDPRITVEVDGDSKAVQFKRESDAPRVRALHGLYRALCQNMVVGVTEGYAKRLEVHGVGYHCGIEGNTLVMNVGVANPMRFEIPSDLTVECPNNSTIDVRGVDKQRVGQFAAKLRLSRPAEPYKGKGVRYSGEQIKRKTGKAVAGG
jgi:large subunit ribosomal protein L6